MSLAVDSMFLTTISMYLRSGSILQVFLRISRLHGSVGISKRMNDASGNEKHKNEILDFDNNKDPNL